MLAQRILLADPHPVFKKGLISVLLEDQKLSFEIDETDEICLKTNFKEKKYDAIIMDLFFPEKSSFDIIRDIKKHCRIPILTMSLYSNETFGLRAFKAGAHGFFNKTQPIGKILDAIEQALNGNKYFGSHIIDKIKNTIQPIDSGLTLDILTNRELQILCLFASSFQTSEIAKKLCISMATVSTHKRNILKKTKLNQESELLQFALTNGLGLKIVDI
jgi:two-component system, NarL family, invasion response regulator UvrY